MFFSCALILILSWALPLATLIDHYLNRSFESALGVAYGLTIGCAVHGLLLMIWLIIRRSNVRALELTVLISSLALLILLAATSDPRFS
jgi:hypothetical protein